MHAEPHDRCAYWQTCQGVHAARTTWMEGIPIRVNRESLGPPKRPHLRGGPFQEETEWPLALWVRDTPYDTTVHYLPPTSHKRAWIVCVHHLSHPFKWCGPSTPMTHSARAGSHWDVILCLNMANIIRLSQCSTSTHQPEAFRTDTGSKAVLQDGQSRPMGGEY